MKSLSTDQINQVIAFSTPATTVTIHVNELASLNPLKVEHNFGSHILCINDGTIVVHHSLPLWTIEVKVRPLGHTILDVLDSGSKIIAMPKHIWEDIRLPFWSDHTMHMSSANMNIDTTIGALENLALDFGMGEVMVQVQILACVIYS